MNVQIAELIIWRSQRIKYGLQMRYNNLISPLTTLYENLWHQSMFYVSYMTLYVFQEISWTSIENENDRSYALNVLYDYFVISRKSYMILV